MMTKEDTQQGQPDWSPEGFQVRFDRVLDANDARPGSLIVSHPTTPFVVEVQEAPDEVSLQSIALDYLNRLRAYIEDSETRQRLGLPERFEIPDQPFLQTLDPIMGWPADWLDSLASEAVDPSIQWAPFEPTNEEGGLVSLASSIDAVRHEGRQDETRTVALLATEIDDGIFLDSGFGLYVIAHIAPNEAQTNTQIRITTMRAQIPFGKFLITLFPAASMVEVFSVNELVSILRPRIEQQLQLQGLTFRKVRLFGNNFGAGKVEFEFRGTGGSQRRSGSTAPFEFVVEGNRRKPEVEIKRLAKSSLVVNAAPGNADLFHQDPMSSQTNPQASDRRKRPTRSGETLNAYRTEHGPFPDPLEEPNGEFRIELSRFVPADLANLPTGNPKSVNLPGGDEPAIRANDFAAVSAYYNTEQFFGRMHAYGINPTDMFHKATLPLRVHYRSGAEKGHGKDGETVNAEVRPDTTLNPPGIEVHLMLANLSHRSRESEDGAVPLGLAAAGRWMWHEFGHVLLLAATGEKEFTFAHSSGDALAAITADPHSRFSGSEVDQGRGVTFPWVFLTRRHDRCVLNGWTWGGTLDPLRRLSAGTDIGDIKTYQAEQILSTSLFRLYRCLGGDTILSGGSEKPDRDARESAAHYAVYLIMQAIRFLALPAPIVEHFVDGLIDADIGTSTPFTVSLESTAVSPPRMGGCAHKLIRWAFEAQGLYQHGTSIDTIVNAPGDPHDVDIYIADNRPNEERTEAGMVPYAAPGGYVPVSLDWQSNQPDPKRWHANEEAIRINGSGLEVMVNNRGREMASNVEVRVWFLLLPVTTDDVLWNDLNAFPWTELNALPVSPQDVAPDTDVTFGPFGNLPAPGTYLFFAEATCADDRANSDAATSLPCSTEPTRIIDLVTGDNNLGLRIIEIT